MIPEIGGDGGEFSPVPNRAEMRARRLSHKAEQPGRSRRQRVSSEQHRADVREHNRKFQQAKRRARRVAAGAELEACEIETTSVPA